MTFYFGDMFPEEYQGDLFVAYHGSWNRKEPTGYKIVTIDMNDFEVNDFATGWLKEGNVLGRPVDIIMNDDGSFFVGDGDAEGIYRGCIVGSKMRDFCHNNNCMHKNILQKYMPDIRFVLK